MDDEELIRRFDAMMGRINVNHETVLSELRAIQAGARSLRDEAALIRSEAALMARREELLDVLRVLSDRIAAFETAVLARMVQTERSINERLAQIERRLRGDA